MNCVCIFFLYVSYCWGKYFFKINTVFYYCCLSGAKRHLQVVQCDSNHPQSTSRNLPEKKRSVINKTENINQFPFLYE